MVCQDLPDYTKMVIIKYTGGFIGLEELATRLGFIAPFDLMGNVVLMEDFETEETEWVETENTANDLVERVSRTKWSGNWSMHVHTDGIATAEAWAHRYFHFPGISKYGLFGRAKWDADLCHLEFGAVFQSLTHTYGIWIIYRLFMPQLAIADWGGGGYIIPTPPTINPATANWFPILLTFDLNTLRGDKLYFAGFEYDISPLVLTATALAASPYAYVWFGTEHEGVCVAHDTWWDDIVLVKNLPG